MRSPSLTFQLVDADAALLSNRLDRSRENRGHAASPGSYPADGRLRGLRQIEDERAFNALSRHNGGEPLELLLQPSLRWKGVTMRRPPPATRWALSSECPYRDRAEILTALSSKPVSAIGQGNFCHCVVGWVDVVRRVRGGRPQTILLFLIMPTIRELIVATPLSLSSPLLPASRLLPPRSGLERSDFVRWPPSRTTKRPA
jgi:hypothetical protein